MQLFITLSFYSTDALKIRIGILCLCAGYNPQVCGFEVVGYCGLFQCVTHDLVWCIDLTIENLKPYPHTLGKAMVKSA